VNYRHGYHAGNFADVLKHAALTRILLHLREKETPFRVIDTHAGAGLYDLTGEQAGKTGEWRGGIGRLWERPPGGEPGRLLAPYLDMVRAENLDGRLGFYPGSPLIVRSLCRTDDQMIFCELHPEERNSLRKHAKNDRRVKISELDGWTALKAFLPPPERRGLVLIDPPFEQEGEFERMEEGLVEAHRRFANGVYLLWYPVKNITEARDLTKRLQRLAIPKILQIEFHIEKPRADGPLNGCGLLAVNPPWKFEAEMQAILQALCVSLQRNVAPAQRLEWIAGRR
jgi:23S rRNA (adenine2030-N6)-methyltransferase